MRRTLALPDEYYEARRSPTRSTRIEQVEDCLVEVVNDVLYDFTDDGSQIATLWVCARPGLVVNARLHSLRSIDRLRASVRSGECIDSPVALLAHLLRDQADVLHGIERDATVRVDRIEDGLLAGATAPARGTLGSLRRVLIRLSRLLAPEPGALFRLLNRPPSWLWRIAVGPRAGQKVFTLQTVAAQGEGEGRSGAVQAGGFSLHAGVSIKPGQRAKLERLCRYVSRSPLAQDRLTLSATGQVC
jgi:Mg2+ and Co2+ transporter CorA